MGIANKIMYDEVPAGTDPLSPENKIVFAVGPLTATGVPWRAAPPSPPFPPIPPIIKLLTPTPAA